MVCFLFFIFSTLHFTCHAHDSWLYSCGVIDLFWMKVESQGWRVRFTVKAIECYSERGERDMDFDPREHEPCLSPAAFVNQVQYSNILEGRFKQLQGKTVCSLRPHSLSLFFLRCICRSSSAFQLTFKPCQITCLLFLNHFINPLRQSTTLSVSFKKLM